MSNSAVVSNAKKTAHLYRCDWQGCDALLNCWENLQKHYYLHCRRAKAKLGKSFCGIPLCPLEGHQVLSPWEELAAHVDRTHLCSIALPCPLTDCHRLELAENLDAHFAKDHPAFLIATEITLSSIAPQALPFRPPPPAPPLQTLPQGILPMYTILSPMALMPPGARPRLQSYQVPEHMTAWANFEFAEHFDYEEEQQMIRQDLGFELMRPSDLSVLDPWPAFSVCAQESVMEYATHVSEPFPPLQPPLKAALDHPQTILYDVFEKWYNSHGTNIQSA